jgi:hypothetical protein
LLSRFSLTAGATRAVARDLHIHVGEARDDFGQRAFPVRRQMYDDDEGHAGPGGHRAETSLQRFK